MALQLSYFIQHIKGTSFPLWSLRHLSSNSLWITNSNCRPLGRLQLDEFKQFKMLISANKDINWIKKIQNTQWKKERGMMNIHKSKNITPYGTKAIFFSVLFSIDNVRFYIFKGFENLYLRFNLAKVCNKAEYKVDSFFKVINFLN